MTPQDEKIFDALTAKRKVASAVLQDESMSGVWDIIIEKYSDQAHSFTNSCKTPTTREQLAPNFFSATTN